jgi:hypothetical protein
MTNLIDDNMVWRAINKWEENAPISLLLNIHALKEHMVKEYGIQLSSAIGGRIEVVDEKKYTMFILRYS